MSIKRFDTDPLIPALNKQATILVPNHRLRVAIVETLANESASDVWQSPQIFAIDIWLKQLWQGAANLGIQPFCEFDLLDSIDEQFLWTSIIENSLATTPLINPDEAAVEVSRAYQQLRQWLLSESDQKQLASYSSVADVAAFLNWKSQFSQQCEKRGLISLVDASHEIISNLEGLSKLLPAQILLVNFLQPPPLYQNLFKQLRSLCIIEYQDPAPSTSGCTTTRLQCQDFDSEVVACANWVKSLQASQPHSHIGIVLNGQPGSQLRLQRLFADILQPETSLFDSGDSTVINCNNAPPSLIDAPLIHDAFLLLGLNSEQQLSTAICRLLKSPHCIGYTEESEARLQFEMFMRRNFTSNCSVSDLSYYLSRDEKPYHSPLLATALTKSRSLVRESPNYNGANKWASVFSSQLETLGFPGEQQHLTEQEKGHIRQWQRALARFSQASNALGQLSLSAALTRLKTLCAQTRQESRFDPKCQLSLFSINDAIGYRFDHLWILSMDDQSWPESSNAASYLPFQLQKQAAIPGSNSELQFLMATETFRQLCESVSLSVVASYHLEAGDKQLRPSPFIADFAAEPSCALSVSFLNSYAAAHLNSRQLVTSEDCHAYPVQAQEKPSGGQSIISNQSSCPFRAFTLHRLQAEPLEEFENGLSRKARGTAIHIALEKLYETIDSQQQLTSLDRPETTALLNQSTDAAIDYLSSKHRVVMSPRFREIERLRIENLLRRFLELEKQRPPFNVRSREEKYQLRAGELELRLKIDRIDTLADGSLAVIDYKTGKFTVSGQNLLAARPEDMQLAVYYSAVSAELDIPINTLGIAHLNVEKIAYSGITAGSDFHGSLRPFNHNAKLDLDWQGLTETLQQKTISLAKEFSAGLATVTPVNRPQTCRYCKLQDLCRIGEIERNLNLVSEAGEAF